ncbi:MAG: helix-turn-helix transcriptional regulator [Syntrophomonadaceae bacterium]|nr:helix-turn-helix transcriptional regulator [Syntrophomonadaceae bacterium]
MKNNVKRLRESFNLTQEQLAKKIGVSRQTIISIEAGRYNPSLILAYKLAKSFGSGIEEVFDFSGLEEDNLNE